MDEEKHSSDSVAKWCESAEDTCGSGAVSNVAPLQEVAPDDCCSESHSYSPATKKYKRNNDDGIGSKRDEHTPSTSFAPKPDKHVVSPIGADVQSLGTDDANVMLEPSAAAESTVEMPTCSHSARHERRNYRLNSDGTSLQNQNRDDTTTAADNNIQLENTPSNSEELQMLPAVESITNTEHRGPVENVQAADFPVDDLSENSTSGSESYSTSGSWYNDEDDEDDYIDYDDLYLNKVKMLHNILQKPKPPYSFNLTYELMRRENGISRDSLRSSLAPGLNSRFYTSRQIVERMKLSDCLRMHYGSVNSLHFDRSGKFLCSGSVDTRIIVWNWAQKKPIINVKLARTQNFLDIVSACVFETKFINSSGILDIVSASRDGQVRRTILPSAGGQPETTLLYRHNGPVHKIVTNPSNSLEIFSAGEDAHIRFKDLRSNDSVVSLCKVKKQINNRRVRLFSIAHHPVSPQICVSGADKFVRVYDKRNMKQTVFEMVPLHLLKIPVVEVTRAVYNSTGSEVLATYSNHDIYLFNNVEYKTGDYLHRYIGHRNYKTLRKEVNFFGPNSDYVISGSDCGNLFIWHKHSEVIVNFIRADAKGVVDCLEPHPIIPALATSGFDRSIKLWAPDSHTTSYLEVSGVAYNSTGTEVLASYNVDDMYLFNNVEYKTGDYLHRYTGHCNHITIAKGVNFFGPKSDYVITGSDCGNIFFWDKDTEAVVNCLPCGQQVSSVEPHPKIPVLAAAGFEHNIKIFAPGSHTHIPDLSKLEANVKHNVRYSTDKKRWLDQSPAVIKPKQLVMSSGSDTG